MNTEDLQNILSTHPLTKSKFKGVFASDEAIPAPSKNQNFYIFNIDPSHKEGSHWIVIMLGRPVNMYFDSYGFPPFVDRFIEIMNQDYVFNKVQLQHFFSTSCGQWSAFFIWALCAGFTFAEFIKLFPIGSDLMTNEHKINFLVNSIFRTKQKVIDKTFLRKQICQQFSNNLGNLSSLVNCTKL